jgi:1-deoxy-D-xylulose-5-phosphate synthase
MPQPLLPTIQGPADLKKLSVDQLPQVADELRQVICKQLARTPGHFAPNLCVVELTVALHYVFNFATDRLLWDVGHQCYPHKLLTGRAHLFGKLKQRGGMAGFPEPLESPYDLFSVGHAGTSISTAVGMARADSLLGQGDRKVVSLIGDASIVNGLAMEGLNNAGTLKRQFLVVLNDNGMAIDKPQGAMAQYFDRVRVSHTFGDLKKRGKKVLKRIPGGSILEEIYHRSGEMVKTAIATDHMFEHFGLVCVGPIDGHDMPTLVDMLNELKDVDRPILLHCKTVKGKGFKQAEGNPFRFHATKPSQFEPADPDAKKKVGGSKSFTAAFADAMIDLMEQDEKVFAITAAMPDGTGLDKVMPKFPKRTLDTGLCESHGMAMAAGMAKSGLKPFFAVYSTFSQRALDQTFQEAALQNLPVRICMDRAGYVGGDGAPMHGFMDITINRAFPKAAILAASDELNLRAALAFMRDYEATISLLRYPRDNVAATPLQKNVPAYELGKACLVRPARGEVDDNKPDLAILGYGVMVYEALGAIKELEKQGYSIDLYDARFAKPVDIDLVGKLIAKETPILTIEDHSLIGGFGAALIEAASDRGLDTRTLHRMGMPDQWIYHDTRAGQLAQAGLDTPGIARAIHKLLDDGALPGVPDVPALEAHVGVGEARKANTVK